MSFKSGVDYAKEFFEEENSRAYDRLVHLATLGQDSVWKKKIIKQVPANILVLDLACGTGILSSLLIENNNKVVGLDLTLPYLNVIFEKEINIDLLNATAEILPFADGVFDCIVTSYLPKYTNLTNLINECHRVLKPRGLVLLHDFTLPKKSLFKYAWRIYFKLIRYLWKNDKKWKNVFAQLDKMIKSTEWDQKIVGLLEAIGFTQIKTNYLTFETSLIVTATKENEFRQ
ncbi:MAG: class I SAM-dependent methyltransferase [Thermoproteota archaeon]|nr:class I SAM-dependent methyltransferase [Thermoproteota archaeon]